MPNLESVIELRRKIKAIKPAPSGSYDDSEVKQDIASLQSQVENIQTKGYDDTEIKNRVTAVENRTDNDTIYDDTALSARVTALENNSSSGGYDDTALVARVEALEAKTDNDTIYDDTALSARVTALENSSSSGGYDDSQILERLTTAEGLIDGAQNGISDLQSVIETIKAHTLDLVTKGVTIETITIAANSRVNIQQEISGIGDYEIICYKQIAIEKATDETTENWKNVFIQSFATAGSNKKCTISLYNNGASGVKIKLNAVVWCKKAAF